MHVYLRLAILNVTFYQNIALHCQLSYSDNFNTQIFSFDLINVLTF